MSDVRCLISIDGEGIPFTRFSLSQQMGTHHHFEVYLSLEQQGSGYLKQKAASWLGKTLHAEFTYASFQGFLQGALGDAQKFNGIVTSISQSRGSNGSFDLIIGGESMCTLVDSSPNTQSFTDMGISEIFDAVVGEYKSKLKVEDSGDPIKDPAYTSAIPYLVQYKETDYQFLARIAAEFGEWFFFNGTAMHLGKIPDSEALPLEFGSGDLYSYELSLKTFPLGFTYKGYNYLKHDFPEQEPVQNGEVSPLAQIVIDKASQEIFPGSNKKVIPYIRTIDQAALKRVSDLRQGQRMGRTVVLSATSGNPKIQLGKTVGLFDEGSMEDHGEFVVTAINHSFGPEGKDYQNSFEAIPKEVAIPPIFAAVDPPFCETQQAEVKETNDPDGLGRVKVQFFWQKGTSETSPWIRVSTTGMGGEKGFFYIPEKGDIVLVDFEHHDPDNPFVIGGFYHGKSKPPWQDPDNNQKAWVTRSGNSIILNDESGKETITISNPSGQNTITMTLDGSPSIAISSEGAISISATEEIVMTSKNISIEADENLSLTAKNTFVEGKTAADLVGGEVNISAGPGKNTAVSGVNVDVSGQMEVSLMAAMVKLNS